MKKLHLWLNSNINGQAIPIFRLLFGVCMGVFYFISVGHQIALHFSDVSIIHLPFYGFSWVPMPGLAVYCGLLISIGVLMLLVGISRKPMKYLILLSIAYTYYFSTTLLDYNNHYYLSLLLIYLFTFSHYFYPQTIYKIKLVPRWNIMIFRWQWVIVYFYAGIAKLNVDWLSGTVIAKTLSGSETHSVLQFLAHPMVARIIGGAGTIVDLFLAFGLLIEKTRRVAVIALISFHLLNESVFFSDLTGDSVGYFPLLGIISTVLFINKSDMTLIKKWASKLLTMGDFQLALFKPNQNYRKVFFCLMTAFLLLQVYLPSRRFFNGENEYFTGEDRQFSYIRNSTMLQSSIKMTMIDKKTKASWLLRMDHYISPNERNVFVENPRALIVLAKRVNAEMRKTNYNNMAIYFDALFSLNGEPAQEGVNPNIDFVKLSPYADKKVWLRPYTGQGGQ